MTEQLSEQMKDKILDGIIEIKGIHWGDVESKKIVDLLDSLTAEDEVYPKCSRCSLYLEMGDDWREQSKKLVDDYIKQTTNYQNQIALRKIEEYIDGRFGISADVGLIHVEHICNWLQQNTQEDEPKCKCGAWMDQYLVGDEWVWKCPACPRVEVE